MITFAQNFTILLLMRKFLLYTILVLITNACIPLKDLKLLQEDNKLKLNDEGYVLTKETEYRLQADDVLSMNIITRDPNAALKFGSEYTSGVGGAGDGGYYLRGLIIREDGNVEIPRIGLVNIIGLTVEDAKNKIQRRFEQTEYVKGEVTVRLQLSGILYTMIGEVGRPGNTTVYRNKLNLIEAFARSGDLTTVADRKNIKLIRQYPEGTKIAYIDLTKESIMNSEYFWVQPNDQFIIYPKVQRTLGTGSNLVGSITALAATLSALASIYFLFTRL